MRGELLTSLKASASAGLILGVKWAIALAVVGFVLVYALTDYTATRSRSLHGEDAYQAILRSQQQKPVQKSP